MAVWKTPAEAATTKDMGPSPTFPTFTGVIDDVSLQAGDRVLVKDQKASIENGYYTVAGAFPPLTLAPTGEIIQADDVTPVKQGVTNAYTLWTVSDALHQLFVRRDVRHYSFGSIKELRRQWQILLDATAIVAGYDEPGDKGGGDFVFIGAPDQARVQSAAAFTTTISKVENVGGLVTLKANGHGLGDDKHQPITRVYLEGLEGLPDGAHTVQVVDDSLLTLPGYFEGVSQGPGARLSYVKLVTVAEHKLAHGQRVSIAGVPESGGATPIAHPNAGPIDGCGVLDPTTLTIPIKTTGGAYAPGRIALLGDDGLRVPATDPEGSVGGLWQRLSTDFIDVRWFGAKGKWVYKSALSPEAMDDLPAFQAAIAALKRFDNRTGVLRADGHFFLNGTLHFHHTVVLEGTGRNEATPGLGSLRSSPGTWLVFPKNVTGLRFHSGNETTGAADASLIRNLTIYCDEDRPKTDRERELGLTPPPLPGQSGHGVWINCQVSCDQVSVENFGENGFYIDAAKVTTATTTFANAGGFQLTKCKSGTNGKHGYFIQGLDATVGLISECEAMGNYSWGFYDDTPTGSTFVACHAEGNLGNPGGYDDDGRNHDYKVNNGGQNASCFLSCYSEASVNEIYFPSMVIGGLLAETPLTPNSTGFALNGGVVVAAPLAAEHHGDPDGVRVELGGPPIDLGGPKPLPHALSLLKTNHGAAIDVLRLLYLSQARKGFHDWWEFQSNGANQQIMRLPTAQSDARHPAPWMTNGLFIGRDDVTNCPIHMTAAPSPPDTQYDATRQTYNHGDIVWNSLPEPGFPIGQVCIAGGTNQANLDLHVLASAHIGDTLLTINRADVFNQQHKKIVTIGGSPVPYRITAFDADADPNTMTITPSLHNEVEDGVAVRQVALTAAPIMLKDSEIKVFTTYVPDANSEVFHPGQYIRLGGEPDVYRIRAIVPPTIEIAPAIRKEKNNPIVILPGVVNVAGAGPFYRNDRAVATDETIVTMNTVEGLTPGQSLTFGEGVDPYHIVQVNFAIFEIEAINPKQDDNQGAQKVFPVGVIVAFNPAIFSSFGVVANPGV